LDPATLEDIMLVYENQESKVLLDEVDEFSNDEDN
jgi:hypothetical protein